MTRQTPLFLSALVRAPRLTAVYCPVRFLSFTEFPLPRITQIEFHALNQTRLKRLYAGGCRGMYIPSSARTFTNGVWSPDIAVLILITLSISLRFSQSLITWFVTKVFEPESMQHHFSTLKLVWSALKIRDGWEVGKALEINSPPASMKLVRPPDLAPYFPADWPCLPCICRL